MEESWLSLTLSGCDIIIFNENESTYYVLKFLESWRGRQGCSIHNPSTYVESHFAHYGNSEFFSSDAGPTFINDERVEISDY